ncbi:MAG: metallophosphoesterase family protein [Pseudomonadota bacterium]
MTPLSKLIAFVSAAASFVRRQMRALMAYSKSKVSPDATPKQGVPSDAKYVAKPISIAKTQDRRIGTVPDKVCVYAIGDIHGRLDLLQKLVGKIQADAEALPADTQVKLIFLGDYIDRGLSSRQVVDFLISDRLDPFEKVFLMGNHEEALLRFIEDASFGQTWANYGGIETLYSYGFQGPRQMMLGTQSDDQTLAQAWDDLWRGFRRSIPDAHLTFYQKLAAYHIIGDYLFVHAGLKPGVPIERQSSSDLLWIRDEFLSHAQPFEKIIVHGHTPADQIFYDHRRIGLDTGAYITGRLSAGRFFGNDVRFIST